MRTVLKNNQRVHILKSDVRAIISQGLPDISKKALPSNLSCVDELEKNTEMKCNLPSAAYFTLVFGIDLGLAWPSLIYKFLNRGRR